MININPPIIPADQLANDCRWLEKLFAQRSCHPKLKSQDKPEQTQAVFPLTARWRASMEHSGLRAFVCNKDHKMMSLFVMSGQMLLIQEWRRNKDAAGYYDTALDTASMIVLNTLPVEKHAARGIFSTLNVACQMTQIALERQVPLDEFKANTADYFPLTHEYQNIKNHLPKRKT